MLMAQYVSPDSSPLLPRLPGGDEPIYPDQGPITTVPTPYIPPGPAPSPIPLPPVQTAPVDVPVIPAPTYTPQTPSPVPMPPLSPTGPGTGSGEIPSRIAIWHRSEQVWYVYKRIMPKGYRATVYSPPIVSLPARQVLSGFGFGDAPPTPSGYAFETTAYEKPADAADGGVADDPIYKRRGFVVGAVALVGLVAGASSAMLWHRRR